MTPKPSSSSLRQLLGASVFVRLSASYAALVIAVAVTLSTGAYFFFQSRYDTELENLHRVLLENIRREVEFEIVNQAKDVYMEAAMDLLAPGSTYFTPDDPAEGNAAKLYQTYQELSNLVNRHSPAVAAVHLYYCDAQVFLSSTRGLKYEATEPGEGRAWLRSLADRRGDSLWVQGKGVITALHSYPLLAPPAEADALVAVDFDLAEVKALLDRFQAVNTGATLLVGPAGQVIASQPEVGRLDVVALLATLPTPQGGRVTLEGRPSLVTVVDVEGADWNLVNVAPLNLLHQKGEGILLILILISLGVVALGLAASLVFAFRLYTPLRRLLGRVLGHLGRGPESGPADEYRILDDAIEGLAATLKSHRPLLQHEFVSRLLQGAPFEDSEYDETLKALDLAPLAPTCRAGCLRLIEGGWVTKYRLVEELGRSTPQVLVTPLEGLDLGLVVATAPETLGDQAQRWLAVAEELGATVCLAFGAPADRSGLGTSFAQARELLDQRFFLPGTRLFLDRDDLLVPSDPGPFPESGLEALSEAFRSRDLERLGHALDAVVAFTRTPGLRSARARAELYRATRAVARAESQGFDEVMESARDVDEWKAGLLARAAEHFAQIENRTDDRNSLLVARVKAYVLDHLSGELSLDKVSSAVGISPGYLSKLFKELTGINFVAFVTEERLVEAERLVTHTRATVQEIGKLVGFNTPAYFIHQFRTRWGATPYEYRRKNPPKA